MEGDPYTWNFGSTGPHQRNRRFWPDIRS